MAISGWSEIMCQLGQKKNTTSNYSWSLCKDDIITFQICLHLQQLAPAKQAKVMQEFQKQSAQMDMTVIFFDIILFLLVLLLLATKCSHPILFRYHIRYIPCQMTWSMQINEMMGYLFLKHVDE